MATWTDVAEVVGEFPETQEGTAYGHRAWRIRKKLLVWERPLRRADLEALGPDAPTGDVLGLKAADLAEKDELITAAPDVFFTIPHFEGHAAVLARLETLPVEVLRQLVGDTWRRLAPKRLVDAFSASNPS